MEMKKWGKVSKQIKIKTKGDPKNSNFGGKTTMHKLTSIDSFLKTEYRPLVGIFAAYGMLLFDVLICYTNLLC